MVVTHAHRGLCPDVDHGQPDIGGRQVAPDGRELRPDVGQLARQTVLEVGRHAITFAAWSAL
jgi:hypothetical protein